MAVIKASRDLTWLREFAKKLKEQGFYGKVELTFQAGKIVNCLKQESIKPE